MMTNAAATATAYVVNSYAADGISLVNAQHQPVADLIAIHDTLDDAMTDAQRRIGPLTHGTWTPDRDMLETELRAAGVDPETASYQAIGYHASEDEGCGGVVIVAVHELA